MLTADTITADTITDEQIRDLDTKARSNGYDADHGTASLCWLALHGCEADQRRARARCAEILNARNAKGSP